MVDFVVFDGNETEKEFLDKCLKQWEMTINNGTSPIFQLIEIGSIFSEIRHRVDEIEKSLY
jgi:hypothetical protein